MLIFAQKYSALCDPHGGFLSLSIVFVNFLVPPPLPLSSSTTYFTCDPVLVFILLKHNSTYDKVTMVLEKSCQDDR